MDTSMNLFHSISRKIIDVGGCGKNIRNGNIRKEKERRRRRGIEWRNQRCSIDSNTPPQWRRADPPRLLFFSSVVIVV